MSRFHVLLVAVLVACTHPRPADPLSIDPVALEEYTRLVDIHVTCPDGREFGGSGTRVGGTTILTARHVVDCDGESPKTVTVKDLQGTEYVATIEGTAPADLARLDVAHIPALPPVEVGRAVTGSRYCVVQAEPERGRRCGELWPSPHGAPGDMLIDFVAEHGNSGGGVWDPQGRLVGVLVHLRWCPGTEILQVCTAGATSLWSRRWIVAP